MRHFKFIGAAVAVVAVAAAVYTAISTGSKSPVILAGKVALKEALVPEAQGIRTLFLILYDQDSPMPMPFGAVKETLSADAVGGNFYDFLITKEKLQMMNPQAAMPSKFRIKIRLDRDGLGGMDQAGDISGELRDVSFGAEGLQVELANSIH